MTRPKVLGIYREEIFSPGKIAEDKAILDATLKVLGKFGYEICTIRGEELDQSTPRASLVLTMAQSNRALMILDEWSREGSRIVNSVNSVANCYRKALIKVLQNAEILIPRSSIVPLEQAETSIASDFGVGVWLKRGDVHAIQEGDVVRLFSANELQRALRHFKMIGVQHVLLQEHVEGSVVKFYGVGKRHFFRVYAGSAGEEVTSKVDRISAVATKAAEAAGLEVYGGDAVITGAHEAVLVDLNDWPSFSRCCESAAEHIARYVMETNG